MKYYLGIDTSNYTTSIALCDENTHVVHKRMLLPVKEGQLGLRQSDAVFHHVQQIPQLTHELFELCDAQDIEAIGVSTRPRDVEGSYMPCFTVGKMLAYALADILKVPVFEFSHQCGHIAAALYSIDRLDMMQSDFIAFHVSGGTTEGLLVSPCEDKIISASLVSKTLDLNAGQLIDRTGVMLGLKFPAGVQIEKLAASFNGDVNVKPVLKGNDCCLSGVENIVNKMNISGEPKEKIAYYVLKFIGCTVNKMCDCLIDEYGDMPIVFAGGVMSDMLIRQWIAKGRNALFAKSEFSADNAAGVSVLTKKRNERI